MNDIIPIILTIIVIIGVISIGYIILLNNILAYNIKVLEAENVIDDLLNQKYDLLMIVKEIIRKETDINKKIFNIKNRSEQGLSLISFERKLTELDELISKIQADYSRVNDDDSFNNTIQELSLLDEKLEAAKVFYNKYTNYLNMIVKKFPSNLIAKIQHIESRLYFDCKNILN